jgi:hypothetical protein
VGLNNIGDQYIFRGQKQKQILVPNNLFYDKFDVVDISTKYCIDYSNYEIASENFGFIPNINMLILTLHETYKGKCKSFVVGSDILHQKGYAYKWPLIKVTNMM